MRILRSWFTDPAFQEVAAKSLFAAVLVVTVVLTLHALTGSLIDIGPHPRRVGAFVLFGSSYSR